jgi:hypothetical protein
VALFEGRDSKNYKWDYSDVENMKSISQIFRLDSVSNRRVDGAIPLPFGVKDNSDEQGRADLKDLEVAYVNDGTIKNGIDKPVSIIASASRELEGNEKSVSFIQEFLDDIGNHGGNTDWETLVTNIFKHQFVYGRAFNELIYDKTLKHILDIDFIDPKTMDYAKTSTNGIALNEFNNPVGFVQTLSFGTEKTRSDTPPNDVVLSDNQIFFAPFRIVQYKLDEIGNGFYGIGWVEPILKPSKWKRVMMEAIQNVYYRAGFPRIGFSVGDAQHEPTNALLQRTVEKLKNSSHLSSFAYPSYVRPEVIEAKKPEKLKEHLQFLIDEEVTTLGPRAFVTGLGDGTNKNTLNRLEFLYKLSLKDTIKKTVSVIENQIFARIAKLEGLPDVPRIVWGEINLEESDSKAKRLVDYTNAGLLQADKGLSDYIRKFEGLPKGEFVDVRGKE